MGAIDTQLADEIRRAGAEAWAKKAQAIREGVQGADAPDDVLVRGSREGTRLVALEDGTGSAYGARVSGDNNLGVEARHGRNSTATTTTNVGTTSTEVVGTTAGRIQATIQNTHDANDLFLRFGTDVATDADLRLGPGEMYSFPPGAAYEGPIQARGSAAATGIVVIEYKL